MREKKVLAFFGILIALFLLSGCVEERRIPAPTSGFCGDGLCTSDERISCSADCTPVVPEREPEVLNWVDQKREERQTNPPLANDSQKYVPVPTDGKEIVIEKQIESALPEKGFSVASRYNLLSIGENISGVMGILTGGHMKQVLAGGSLRKNSEAFGPRFSMYEQLLTVRSGRVVFGYDEETDQVSTYLEFKEKDPIFDYLIRLNSGIFKFFEGETINFLGHKYALTEVTNSSIVLVSIDSTDTLILRNGHSAIVNGEDISPHVLNVTIDKNYIRVMVSAEDDFKMLPGQSLTDFMRRKVLLTNRLDLTYQGLTKSPIMSIPLKKSSNNYKLTIQNNKLQNYTIPIARINPFMVGNEEYKFHFKEADGNNDFIIGKKDYFIINNNRETGGITTLLRMTKVDYTEELITFEDPALEKFYVKFDGTPGTNAFADLIVYGVNHRVFVGTGERVAIDLNGDGQINSASVPIITFSDNFIRFDQAGNSLGLKFITPGRKRENSKTDLETKIIIDNKGVRIPADSLKMEHDEERDQLVGLSDYGTLFMIKREVDEDDQSGYDLTIIQPISQRFAEVFVKAYE